MPIKLRKPKKKLKVTKKKKRPKIKKKQSRHIAVKMAVEIDEKYNIENRYFRFSFNGKEYYGGQWAVSPNAKIALPEPGRWYVLCTEEKLLLIKRHKLGKGKWETLDLTLNLSEAIEISLFYHGSR